jgi:hypothetical protein
MCRVKGMYGVYWAAKQRRWRANIRYNLHGKKHTHRIGDYEFAIDAANAYDVVARRIFGRFAKLNNPTEEDKKCATST